MEERYLEKKSADDEIVEEHKSIRHFTKVVITPEHVKRAESKEFIKNKNRLKVDGIHETTFPVLITQKIFKEGVQPVPQDN